MTDGAERHSLQPTVSVVLASHNGARFIEEQVRSIVGQTLPPDEVVLSDDASADDTVERATLAFESAMVERGGRAIDLRVLRNPRALGVSRNFEAGCAASTGELIALCDQDDVWEPVRLATMVGEFEANPTLTLLHSDATLIDESGEQVGASLLAAIRMNRSERRAIAAGQAFEVLLRRNVVTGATTMFRRDLLRRAQPFPEGWVHDEWLGIVAASTGTVRLLDLRLTRYRQHSANQIGASTLTLRQGVRRVFTPREERNARLREHAQTLHERLRERSDLVSNGYLEKAAAKLRHEEFRSSLPAVRFARVVPVVRATLRGSYRRYSRGIPDVVRDIVQPA